MHEFDDLLEETTSMCHKKTEEKEHSWHGSHSPCMERRGYRPSFQDTSRENHDHWITEHQHASYSLSKVSNFAFKSLADAEKLWKEMHLTLHPAFVRLLA